MTPYPDSEETPPETRVRIKNHKGDGELSAEPLTVRPYGPSSYRIHQTLSERDKRHIEAPKAVFQVRTAAGRGEEGFETQTKH